MDTSDPREHFQSMLNDPSISSKLATLILRSCSVHDIPGQTYLHHVADDPGGMWCLAEGALSVEFAPGVRDLQTSYLLLPPIWVGEGGVITGNPRSVGFSTTRRSILLHLPLPRFFAIAKDDPTIWRWVAKVQKLNFERAIRMTDALMVRGSEARVTTVLLQLGGQIGPDADRPRELDLTQAQLAAIANVSRSALSPILQALSAKGTIELGHRTITILDPAALR
jgi:CRP-like cAMP-binding protein